MEAQTNKNYNKMKEKKMVIIITQTSDKGFTKTTRREVVGDDLSKEEIEFIYREIGNKLR